MFARAVPPVGWRLVGRTSGRQSSSSSSPRGHARRARGRRPPAPSGRASCFRSVQSRETSNGVGVRSVTGGSGVHSLQVGSARPPKAAPCRLHLAMMV
eukprot:2397235-Prymnesium_polylepis.2